MNEKKVSRRDFLKKYGIGGLSALILLAMPNEVKAGVSDNLSSAEGTSFDDTAAQLGASNVQKAIEKVKGSVDDLSVNKANVSQLSDGSVTKVGTGTVGGANTPIYLNAGVPKACNEFAPKSHASTGTGYGVGNGSNYGHVKLSDTYATEQSNVAAANSVGASAYALQQAYKTLNNNIDTLKNLGIYERRPDYWSVKSPTNANLDFLVNGILVGSVNANSDRFYITQQAKPLYICGTKWDSLIEWARVAGFQEL